MLSRILLAGLLPAAVLARTDLTGCTSSVDGASLIWYVPGTGELCEFIDCGGGRAAPITTKPGCAGYSGTATVTPSFLPGFGGDAVASETSTESAPAAASSTVVSSAVIASSGTITSPAPTTTSTTDVLSQPGVVVISGKDGTTTTISPSGAPTAGGNGTNTSLPPGVIVTDGKTSTVFGTNKPPTKTTSGVTASTAGAVALSGAGGLLGAAAAIGVAAML